MTELAKKELKNRGYIVLDVEPDPKNTEGLRVRMVYPEEGYLDKDGFSDLFEDATSTMRIRVRDSGGYRVFGVTADRDENTVVTWERRRGGSIASFQVPEKKGEFYTDFFMLIAMAEPGNGNSPYRVFDPPVTVGRIGMPAGGLTLSG